MPSSTMAAMLVASLLATLGLAACGGDHAAVGSYSGTLGGTYTDMDAPGPDGTGQNRTVTLAERSTLVVTKAGDDAYRLQLGSCALTTTQVRNETAMDFGPANCTLRIGARGPVALTHVMGTATFDPQAVTLSIHGNGPTRPDGMRPQLGATFTGQRAQ